MDFLGLQLKTKPNNYEFAFEIVYNKDLRGHKLLIGAVNNMKKF